MNAPFAAPPHEWWSDAVLERLANLADEHAEAYAAADPFPHVVIDNFFPEGLLTAALDRFPSPEALKWAKFNNVNEKKLAFSAAERLPVELRDLLYFLNGPAVLQFLERLTGIEHLVADPYYEGGGLHQIPKGGKLGIHADFNIHYTLNLDRRLNLLLYLNKDWPDEFGGQLELWDRSMTGCVKKVAPIFNRCVVFNTTSDAWHGHPHALTCPEGVTRKSIATYYYTNGRPEDEQHAAHSTLFQDLPAAEVSAKQRLIGGLRGAVKAITPPIITDAIWALKHRS